MQLPSPPVIETLAAYSRQEVNSNVVMRALLTHDDWSAPALYAADCLKTTWFEKISVWGTASNMPANELWLFTDEERGNAVLERGGVPGTFANKLPALPLFRAIPRHLECVKVNPGGEQAHFWYIGNDAFELVELWVTAIALEAVLKGPATPEFFAAIRDFTSFTVLITEQNLIATAVGAGGMKNPAMAFTTPDCAAKIMAQAPGLREHAIDGKTLFKRLPEFGVDGCFINPLGPGQPAIVKLEDCGRVLAGA